MKKAIGRGFEIALLGLAFLAIAGVAVPGLLRVMSPFEFGVGDGLMLDHILRVAHGQPLYVEPSLSFISLAYMPLYVYVVAPLVWLFGPHFWPGRLVSLLASLGTAYLMMRVIRRETGSVTLGVAGAGLYLIGQGFTKGSYDSIRPDPLMLFLVIAGLATLRFSRGIPGAIGAAALLSAAFFTKQHALCFAGVALLHLLFSDRRRLPAFALTLVVGCGGVFLLLTRVLGPWFSFYVYDVPSHWSHLSRGRIFTYLGSELIGRFGALSIPAVLSLMLPERPWKGASGLWWWVGLGGAATGVLATLDPYAFVHTLMPTLAAFAVLGPIALHRLAKPFAAEDGPAPGMAVTCAVLILAFVPLLYPVRAMVPPRRNHSDFEAFERQLRGIPGPLMIPSHGFFAWSAGKGTSLHTLPLDDIVRARGNRLLKRDPEFFERMFARLRSGPGRPVIIADTTLEHCADASTKLWASLGGSYRETRRLDAAANIVRPAGGYRGTPSIVYEPIEPAAGAGGSSAALHVGAPAETTSAQPAHR